MASPGMSAPLTWIGRKGRSTTICRSSFTSVSLFSTLFVGLSAFLQVVFQIPPGNFDGVVTRAWIAIWGLALGLAAITVVVASILQDEHRPPPTRVKGLRIEVAGLVGFSVTCLAYVVASLNLLSPLGFLASPGSMAIAALAVAFGVRAVVIVRTVTRAVRGCG